MPANQPPQLYVVQSAILPLWLSRMLIECLHLSTSHAGFSYLIQCGLGTMIVCMLAAFALFDPKIHFPWLWTTGPQSTDAFKTYISKECVQLHHQSIFNHTFFLCHPSFLQSLTWLFEYTKSHMAQIDHIPFDILRMIIVRLISPSVESLDDWTECISVLAVSRLWRMIGQPLLYSNIVIDLDALSTVLQTIHSNTSLVVSNGLEDHVRATVIHISPDLDRADAIAAFLFYMPTSLTTNLSMPNTMRGFWRMSGNPTTFLGGACIEPLLLSMPNLRYLFVESRFMNEPWMGFMSMFLNYSVARQVNSRIGVSWFTEFDFITSFNNEGIAPLDSNAAMTRMVLAPSSREQFPLSRSRRRFVPSDDRVIFSAEYIRRLRILDIPQSALGLDASIDALRDRNPCLPRENDTLNLWYNTRYRSYLYVPNIWFENSTNGVTRYELFAFNRNANDHMLQIANSMPPEDSESAQYPDFISDYASSGSDPDDGYFSL